LKYCQAVQPQPGPIPAELPRSSLNNFGADLASP
jgi:hypothetical protein